MTKQQRGIKAGNLAGTKRLDGSVKGNGFWPGWWRLAANHNQIRVGTRRS